MSELPSYTQHMDVSMLCYKVDDYTKFIYPLKLHESLASGLPCVGAPIRTLQEFRVGPGPGGDRGGMVRGARRGAQSDRSLGRRAARPGARWRATTTGIGSSTGSPTAIGDRLGPSYRQRDRAGMPDSYPLSARRESRSRLTRDDPGQGR